MKKILAWSLQGIGYAGLALWLVAAAIVAVVALFTLVLVSLPFVFAAMLTNVVEGKPVSEVIDAARAEIISFPAMEP